MVEQVCVAAQAHRARETAFTEEPKRVEEDQCVREARIKEKWRRVNQEHANAGLARQHALHNAAEIERCVCEAEKSRYERATSEAAYRETVIV